MIICADDYGMRADIDRAIIQLCENNKLSAVSCMVLFQRCDGTVMEKIRAHEGQADIGLHFCLTDENLPLSAPLDQIKLPSFGKLLRSAFFRNLRPKAIFSLLAAQYELFVQKSGRVPDYIDGHLHAHQLPVVAEVLVDFVRQLPAERRPYVRNTRISLRELRREKLPHVKAGFIGAFGARLERKLHTAGIATNSGFSGIYDFKDYQRYAEFFPKFIACLPEKNGILVTHPGFDAARTQTEFETLQNFSHRPNRFVHRNATSAMPLR